MAIKLKNSSNYFPFIDHKGKRTKSLSIGFEWEVNSLDSSRYEHFDYEKVYSNGFRYHPEFGIEFQSPVATNLEQARMAARFLQKELKRVNYPLTSCSHQSGIHVTVAPVSWKDGYSYHSSNLIQHSIRASLNHSSFKDFLWKFSGRPNIGGYSNQAVATCWDSSNGDYFTNVVRFQASRGGGACEFRFWAGKSDRLIPALEFSHSFFTFCFNKIKVPLDRCVSYTELRSSKLYVTLPEYKEWLSKRKGYTTLKRDKAWDNS